MITIFYSHLLLCNHFLWPRWAKLYCQNRWGPCPDKPPLDPPLVMVVLIMMLLLLIIKSVNDDIIYS